MTHTNPGQSAELAEARLQEFAGVATFRSPGGADETGANRDREIALQIEATMVARLYRIAPGIMAMGIVGVVALVALVAQEQPVGWPRASIWLLSHFAAIAAGEFAVFRGASFAPDHPAWRRWLRIYVAVTWVAGSIWSIGALILFRPTGPPAELLIVVFLLAQSCGTALSMNVYRGVAFAYILSLTVPLAVWFFAQGDIRHFQYGIVATLYIIGIVSLVTQSSGALARSLRAEYEKQDLIEKLTKQMLVAEEASRAKSRFLASASHDLRQPVHALSMFIGALREQPLTQQALRIVDQASASIEGLDSLFASLLDISKLDAGVVKPKMQPIQIGLLLRRLCEEFRIDAENKGLRLIDIPCSVIVESDVTLLENVVRNLLSNALRYTDSGRVLVGCRRGARLSIEILDTGRGIAPKEIDKIFEEFYQIGNPERDRRQGLGLGLAIVKRVATMIGCEVTIASRLERGTRVRIQAPVSKDSNGAPDLAHPEASSIRDQGVVFFIDDETLVRDATKSLLESWGYRVVAAESGAQLDGLTVNCPLRPDLIVSDLRLRDGENGIAIMNRLRADSNEDIPGIVITGDTAPERLAEADASGYLVLHKPLSSSKLRAALRSLTARGDGLAP